MKKWLILFWLVPMMGMSQTFTNVKIDEGSSRNGPEEPSIAISLTDTTVMVAGVNIKVTYRSNDGGFTWKKKHMKSRYGVYGDPCIISTDKGKFMYFHLALPRGTAYEHESFLDRIVCQTSRNGGKRFTRGKYMGHTPPKDQDKEWAVFDVANQRTYTTWTQFDTYGSADTADKSVILASYSDDEGKHWSEPVVMSQTPGNCIDDDQTTEGAVPAVGLNGEMYVAWSNNGHLYFNSLKDDTLVGKEKIIANQVGGWTQEIDGLNRTNGLPITVSDVSQGPHRGSIYVCWSDQRNGELNTDVFLTKSTDGGVSWSPAKRVNDDHTQTHQFLPWVTIDQTTGYIYIVSYDRRNYTDAQTDVFLAVSKDGGETFTNHKISETPFTPLPHVFFGDYINISAHNGVVRPIWTCYENGMLSVWTAIVSGL